MKQKDKIIFKDNITDDEIEDIIMEIKKVSGITFYSSKDIRRFEILSIYYLGEFIGVIFFKEKKDYIDFKVGFIKEKYRNQGYMKLLLQKFLNIKFKKIYCASKNKFMINLLLANEFKKIKFTKLPIRQQLNQIALIFNIQRIKEYIRKRKLDNASFEFFQKNIK